MTACVHTVSMSGSDPTVQVEAAVLQDAVVLNPYLLVPV